MISLRFILGVLLVMGTFAIPNTVAADDGILTYIDVRDTECYDPNTNTFTTDITKTDSDENLIVQVREQVDKNLIKLRSTHFYLYEKRGSDMNGNGITRERLWEESDYCSWSEDDYEVNIAKWFQTDELRNLPYGEYDVLIYFPRHTLPGVSDLASSTKLITLKYNPVAM